MRSRRILLLTVTLAVSLSACAKEEPAAPAQAADSAVAVHAAEAASKSIEERLASGEKLYSAHCAACHQATGKGLAGAFPPLAASSYLADGPAAAIDAVLNGLSGPITVNGNDYNAVMPSLSYLSDSDVADVITFVMNTWGNPGGEVASGEVAATRGGALVTEPADHPVSAQEELARALPANL
jgi:mono/diheme cytochrome c family protein